MPETRYKPFELLGRYNWPSTSVNRGFDLYLERVSDRLKSFIGRDKGKPDIELEELDALTGEDLDRVAAPPAIHPLLNELTLTLADWLGAPVGADNLKTIVLPPCERECFLSQWAETRECKVLGSDAALDDILSALNSDPEDADPIVIPRLELRFTRHVDGMAEVRLLIEALAETTRKVMIGCNSWAWQYLIKSCEIDAVLGRPLTFQAYDGERLRHWLSELAENFSERLGDTGVAFRVAKSGEDAFASSSDTDNGDSYMDKLSKRSAGVPWVAWEMWRDSLRIEHHEAKSEGDHPLELDEADTIWVDDPPVHNIPDRRDQNALLVLQALLIHGRMTEEDIRKSIPFSAYTNVLSALIKTRLIERDGDYYRCTPIAYPTIREGLKLGGYPMDVL